MRRGLLATAAAALALAALGAGLWWRAHRAPGVPAGFAVGNGRLEARQIDVASKFAGRVAEVLAREGDRVEAGQVVARMDTASLAQQLVEARAQVANARSAKATALASVRERRSGAATALAQAAERESELALERRQVQRASTLFASGSIAQQQLDVEQSRLRSAAALLAAARAQVDQARAAVDVSLSQADAADAAIAAAQATEARIQTDLADGELKAPRTARVQHRLVEPGEVVAAGNRILELVDLSDVYMDIYLPEADAGRLAMGSEARLLLDAAPQLRIPARVSFVASESQFTPKIVETRTEREKLVFEVRLQLDPAGLVRYEPLVKVGLPGVGYVRVDPGARWPESLAVQLPPVP